MTEQERLLNVMESVDEMRDMTRSMVAGFVADGFSDEQAREMTVAIMKMAAHGQANAKEDQ